MFTRRSRDHKDLVARMLEACRDLHVLRDPTRGGVAATLLEIAGRSGVDIELLEDVIPVRDDVRGACEILGFDPLYVANEGKLVAFVPAEGVYNEQIRVPLINYQGGRYAGARVRDLVRLVDVLPTLAERIGFRFDPPGFTAPGRSLWPLLRAPWWPRPDTTLFAQRRPADGGERAYWERGEVFSLQDLDWKYVVHTQGKDEFFDLRADPLELRSLVDAPSPVKESLGRKARQAMASLQREGARVRPVPFEPRTREELRALGYVN